MSKSVKVETGAELLARLGRRQSQVQLGGAAAELGWTGGEVVELGAGEDAVAGTTELLLDVVVAALLSPRQQESDATRVVWVDCALRFPTLRLTHLLQSRLEEAASLDNPPASCLKDEGERDDPGGSAEPGSDGSSRTDGLAPTPAPLGPEEVCGRAAACLHRVQVVQCCSSQQLLTSLFALTAVDSCPALLVIDPVSAFFWADRSCGWRQLSSAILHKSMSHVALAVKMLADSRGLLVVASRHEWGPRVGSSRPADQRRTGDRPPGPKSRERGDCLGKAWSEVVTHRLVCRRGQDVGTGGSKDSGPARYTLVGETTARNFAVSENGLCFVGSVT